jgi:hypothetical protein
MNSNGKKQEVIVTLSGPKSNLFEAWADDVKHRNIDWNSLGVYGVIFPSTNRAQAYIDPRYDIKTVLKNVEAALLATPAEVDTESTPTGGA